MKTICILTVMIALCHGMPNLEGLTREEEDPIRTTVKSAQGPEEGTTTKLSELQESEKP